MKNKIRKKENRLSYSQRYSVYNVDNKELFHKARSSFVFRQFNRPTKAFCSWTVQITFCQSSAYYFLKQCQRKRLKWLSVWGVFLIIILQKKNWVRPNSMFISRNSLLVHLAVHSFQSKGPIKKSLASVLSCCMLLFEGSFENKFKDTMILRLF